MLRNCRLACAKLQRGGVRPPSFRRSVRRAKALGSTAVDAFAASLQKPTRVSLRRIAPQRNGVVIPSRPAQRKPLHAAPADADALDALGRGGMGVKRKSA
jgi:hypothetical protein